MATQQFADFLNALDRAEAHIRIFERGRKQGRPKLEDTQLNRSAVVFAIGALDAYFHDLVVSVVTEHVPQSDDLSKALREMQPVVLVQDLVRASTHADMRASFASSLIDYFNDKNFMDIKGLLRALRFVGCPTAMEQLADETGRPNLAADLADYTDIRHRVIHRGENVTVHKEKARTCAATVRAIADTVDAKVESKYS